MAQRIKIGDCYELSLPDGRYAYCQYINWNERLGNLVRVFDLVKVQPVEDVAQLKDVGDMFPPVFVGLRASVRSGRWKLLGHLPVKELQFPLFRATSATKPGTHKNWWIWDGHREQFIGALSENLRSLELKVVWGDELLEERIATGKNPFAGIQ
jgi:hypothetical protein